MKKYLILLVALLASLLVFTACGSTNTDLTTTDSDAEEETSIESYDIVSGWEYTGKDNEDNDVTINIDLEDDDNFSIEYICDKKADDVSEVQNAYAEGTYTYMPAEDSVGEGNGSITFNFNTVTDEESKLFADDVKVDNSVTVNYLVSDEGVMLALNEADLIFPNMPSQIHFAKVD